MKQLVVILLTICYVLGLLMPFNTYVGYCLNKEYITENLCVNQAKPELDCEGKCYLMEELATQVKATTDPRAPINNNVKALTIHNCVALVTLNFYFSDIILDNQSEPCYITQGKLLPIDNPPEFFV